MTVAEPQATPVTKAGKAYGPTVALAEVAGFAQGNLASALWRVPPVLLIVVTLGMNGILQGVASLCGGGTPSGFAPLGVRWVMTGPLLGVPPVIWLILIFIVLASLLLSRTAFGRRVYAVGMVGGVLLLTALQTLPAGTTTPPWSHSAIVFRVEPWGEMQCSVVRSNRVSGFS